MKKVIVIITLFVAFAHTSKAQVNLDDFGRIILNTYLPDKMNIPNDSKQFLETRLNQITSNNGIGGSQANSRFIITASVNVGTKDIIPGPPQMIAQNLEVSLFIGDAITNAIFSNVKFSLKGIGTNENKAFVDAFKKINPKNNELASFIEIGKKKINDYYSSQCDLIIRNAQTLSRVGKYDEAIYSLSIVPKACEECFFKCLDTLVEIYQQKIDADCSSKLNEAKRTWIVEQNRESAQKAAELLKLINSKASCQNEVSELINTIDTKLKTDDREQWEFFKKQYEDQLILAKEELRIAEEKSIRDNEYREKQALRNLELDKMNSRMYQEIAVEYAKHLTNKLNYNNVNWR